jgi:hypothetical protein
MRRSRLPELPGVGHRFHRRQYFQLLLASVDQISNEDRGTQRMLVVAAMGLVAHAGQCPWRERRR